MDLLEIREIYETSMCDDDAFNAYEHNGIDCDAVEKAVSSVVAKDYANWIYLHQK